jgi:malonate transporter MadL subunit
MTIYGVAILAACYLAGQLTGEYLGYLLGIDANIGGVGFGMLLLLAFNQWFRNKDVASPSRWVLESQDGIRFWSAMYLPIIVAMSATQNVAAALSGGAVAVVAGATVTIIPLLMLPLISRLVKTKAP